MTLDPDQRRFFDSIDNFTEQTFVSTQYATMIISNVRAWKAEGRPVSIDDVIEWARQREHSDLKAGILAGFVLAIQWEDHPFSRPG
jgi:hypothetical protein